MRCRDVQQIISSVAGTGARLNRQAQDHLAGCADCQHFAQQSESLDLLLAVDADQEPRPGFDTRVFARLNEQKQRPRAWWALKPSWLLAGAALATAATIVLVIAGQRQGPPPPSDLELAMRLEMLEDIDVARDLETIEAFEVLALLDSETLRQATSASPEAPQ